jgi:7-carboxy-7-deazaguanine synthase
MKAQPDMAERNPRLLSQKDLQSVMGAGVVETLDPELKRAFQFADNAVPDAIRDPEKLRMKPGHLKLSGDGVFYTLQGEGPSMGEPTSFLRLKICNLACGWCDAWYTWNPKSPEFWQEGKDIPTEDVAQMVRDNWGAKDPRIQRRLVITGGEPLIQKGEIDILMDALPEYKFEIETNGTIMPTEKQLAEAQFNCSPKLANSANIKGARIKPDVLTRLAEANTMFKFVVMTPEDLDEIDRDYVQGVGIHPEKVIVMPQGVTADEVRMNAQNVVEEAKARGFRLMGRLQNEIWGAKRGV